MTAPVSDDALIAGLREAKTAMLNLAKQLRPLKWDDCMIFDQAADRLAELLAENARLTQAQSQFSFKPELDQAQAEIRRLRVTVQQQRQDHLRAQGELRSSLHEQLFNQGKIITNLLNERGSEQTQSGPSAETPAGAVAGAARESEATIEDSEASGATIGGQMTDVIAALRADAERYKYLRDVGPFRPFGLAASNCDGRVLTGPSLDKEIDAAIAKGGA